MEKTRKFIVVSENGYKDVVKTIDHLQKKYGKDITLSDLLTKLDTDVLILN